MHTNFYCGGQTSMKKGSKEGNKEKYFGSNK
jgi:hypothetical protein